MKTMASAAVLGLTLGGAVVAQGPAGAGQPPLAFSHVTVIDATGRPAQPDMTVVVSGDRITAVARTGSLTAPEHAHVIDASGKYLIPGLWDMHQHTFMRKNKLLPLLSLWGNIINGVTGVRDMGDQGLPDDFGDLPSIEDFEWRQAIDAGAVVGPRLVLAGFILEGPPTPRKGWPEMRTPEQAREEVRFLKRFGVDFVKVHDSLSRDVFFAIADESKKQGLVFAGHVTNTVSVGEASDAGQKSEEHMLGMLVACSTEEATLAREVAAHGLTANARALADTFSESKAQALYARFVRNGTAILPSFVREWSGLRPRSMTDPRLAFASPAQREEIAAQASAFRPQDAAANRIVHDMHYRIVREMQAAGVQLLAGTDGRMFGFDLHDELQEEVTAGLTPMQALQTATRNAAAYLGRLDSLGTVETGKLADLVLLDANPLDAIANTTKVHAVVVNGRLLDRRALDRMEAQMKQASQPDRVQ